MEGDAEFYVLQGDIEGPYTDLLRTTIEGDAEFYALPTCLAVTPGPDPKPM